MNSNSETPQKLYQIIINSILQKIEQNQFSFEIPICTEKQLMEEFQVSRITAKRAITELEYRGILYRKRGAGSFVARDIYQQNKKKNTAPTVFAFVLPFSIKSENLLHMIAMINTRLSASDCLLSLYISERERSRERSILKKLLEQDISGLLFYPSSADIHLDLLNQFVLRGLPVIIDDQPITTPYLYNILCDNVAGAKMLTEHLISLRHRNIAFFSIANIAAIPSVAERMGGFLDAMRGSSLFVNPDFIISGADPSPTALEAQLRTLINAGVTAIVCENDDCATALMQVCSSMSVRVPEDISICGFCNNYPDITSIGLSEDLMADPIADIFLESLTPGRTHPHKILVPTTFHAKSSTGPRPVSIK